MRFEELNWMDVENYLKKEDRLMLVIGACEQHGYLSLLTDVRIPLALADAASQQAGVLIAPTVNFGCSAYFMKYPGTISLRASTLLDLVEDILRSVYSYGFRRILILNGHGGNEAARARLSELANALPGIHLRWYAWWQAPSVQDVAAKHGLRQTHANWQEAFPFTRVVELPEEEKPFPRLVGTLSAEEERQALGDGSFGGPYQAPVEIMDEIFAAALKDILELLQFQ